MRHDLLCVACEEMAGASWECHESLANLWLWRRWLSEVAGALQGLGVVADLHPEAPTARIPIGYFVKHAYHEVVILDEEQCRWPILWVSPHSMDRYQEHHPDADRQELVAALCGSQQIDSLLAHALCGRHRSPNAADRFFLAPDRRGLFVVVEERVATYLRFGIAQERFALEHFPSAGQPSPPPQPSAHLSA